MSDIRSSQVTAQVEYQEPSLLKTSQVIAQVEYTVPEYGTYTGRITFSLTPESDTSPHFEYTGDITASFIPASDYGGATDYHGLVTVSLIPESNYLVDFTYVGNIVINVIPESDIAGDYGYSGLVTATLDMSSSYRMPIIGFDWWSGYGLVDLTFLLEPPPYYVITGEIEASITFSSPHETYREYAVIGSGGVEIAGEGTAAFEKPDVYTVTGSGGIKTGGAGVIVFVKPVTYTVVSSGGLKINGEGVVCFVDAPEIPEYAVVGSGGVEISGRGAVIFVSVPAPYIVVGSGGYELSGKGTVVFVDADDLTYTVVGSGGYELSGEGIVSFVSVNVFALVGSGGFEAAGAGLLAYFYPNYFSVVGSGGMVISGEGSDEEFLYQTWVFSGVDLKPSIYSNYNFNSYCEHEGRYYGADYDYGIFELIGATDNGDEIHTGLKIGPTNLGSLLKKRLRSVYIGAHNQSAKAKVEIGREDLVTTGYFTATNGKFPITRDLYGEEITLHISDFNEISIVEILPIILNIRGR